MSGFIDFADVKARCSIEQAAKPLGLKCTAAAIANWKTDSPRRILGRVRIRSDRAISPSVLCPCGSGGRCELPRNSDFGEAETELLLVARLSTAHALHQCGDRRPPSCGPARIVEQGNWAPAEYNGRHYQTAPPSHLSEAGNQQQDGSRGVRLIANDMTGTGRDPVSAVRLPVELTANVDAWAESREISRSEAIRRLVELGLKAKAK